MEIFSPAASRSSAKAFCLDEPRRLCGPSGNRTHLRDNCVWFTNIALATAYSSLFLVATAHAVVPLEPRGDIFVPLGAMELPTDVAAHNNLAFVLTTHRLLALDVAPGSTPRTIDFPVDVYGQSLCAWGTNIVVVNSIGWASKIGLTPTGSPSGIAAWNVAQNADLRSITVRGQYGFTVGAGGVLRVLDFATDPKRIVWSRDLSGAGVAGAADEAAFYMTTGQNSFRYLPMNASTGPTGSPITVQAPGATKGVTADGGYAYIACGAAGLLVFDSRTPTTLAQAVALHGPVSHVAIAGTNLFCAITRPIVGQPGRNRAAINPLSISGRAQPVSGAALDSGGAIANEFPIGVVAVGPRVVLATASLVGDKVNAHIFVASTIEAPRIVQQPWPVTVNPGQQAAFSGSITGTPPLAVQWYKNASAIPLATNLNLRIPNAAPEDQGSYMFTVTNLDGLVNSMTVNLTVREAPKITAEPADLFINEGGRIALFASVAGTPPISYQWYKNGSKISGQTDEDLFIPIAHLGDAGIYSLVASNQAGIATSAPASLVVRSRPRIEQEPLGRRLPVGTTVMLSVVASGWEPLHYQWFKQELDMPVLAVAGAVGPNLSAQIGDRPTRFFVNVTNAVGIATSLPALLQSITPPKLEIISAGIMDIVIRIIGEPGTEWEVQQSLNLRDWQHTSTLSFKIPESGAGTMASILTTTNSLFYRVSLL